MKSLQKLKLILILFFALTLSQSCDRDDLVDQFDFDDSGYAEYDDSDEDWPDDDFDNDSSDDDDSYDSEGSESRITAYSVSGTTITKSQDYNVSGQLKEAQDDVAKHQEIWELVKKIVPESYMSKMGEFEIYWGEADGSAGYVVEMNPDLSVWKMGIAIDYAYEGGFNADGELAHTIIHEFGHILTLDNTQLDSSISESNCQNYYPGEGCANKESYINQLHSRFWADIWSDFQSSQDSESGMQSFYSKHSDRFVTQYAATNPGEDIAEVFATFVTSSTNSNANTIASQKLQLMFDYSELIELRQFIRGNTSSARGRSYLPVAGSWKKANTIGNPKKGCVHRI